MSARWIVPAIAIGAGLSLWLGTRMFRDGQSTTERAASQAMFGIVTLGWSVVNAGLVNAGFYRDWALEWRFLLGLAALVGALWGIGQLLAATASLLVDGLSPGRGLEIDDPYFLERLGPLTLYFVVMVTTIYLVRRIPTTVPRAVPMAVGGFLFVAAVVWPRWFAQHFVVDELLHRLPPAARRPVLGATGLLGIIVEVWWPVGATT